jgi:hypothetical protein
MLYYSILLHVTYLHFLFTVSHANLSENLKINVFQLQEFNTNLHVRR